MKKGGFFHPLPTDTQVAIPRFYHSCQGVSPKKGGHNTPNALLLYHTTPISRNTSIVDTFQYGLYPYCASPVVAQNGYWRLFQFLFSWRGLSPPPGRPAEIPRPAWIYARKAWIYSTRSHFLTIVHNPARDPSFFAGIISLNSCFAQRSRFSVHNPLITGLFRYFIETLYFSLYYVSILYRWVAASL